MSALRSFREVLLKGVENDAGVVFKCYQAAANHCPRPELQDTRLEDVKIECLELYLGNMID